MSPASFKMLFSVPLLTSWLRWWLSMNTFPVLGLIHSGCPFLTFPVSWHPALSSILSNSVYFIARCFFYRVTKIGIFLLFCKYPCDFSYFFPGHLSESMTFRFAASSSDQSFSI